MEHEPKIKLSKVMPPNVRTIDQMAAVWEAMQQIKEYRFSSLIVDRKDIADQVVANKLSFDRINVYEIMRAPVLTQNPDTDIRHAINIINRFKISRAVVLDEDIQLRGIVTLRDMVLWYAVARKSAK